MAQAATPGNVERPVRLIAVILFAVALTGVFWQKGYEGDFGVGLWTGGGLVGGDMYPYFFPQKQFFADELKAGRFPLWNNLVGFGYPLVAESQTGALYPINPVLYRVLNPNNAYNASQLLHYVLAFLFTWLFARRLSVGPVGAALAALIYTYGWFPPRICLEWAIIGGAWFPCALWGLESFLQTARWRWLLVLTAGIALPMLAGHFNLAFIAQLTIACYIPARLFWARGGLAPSISAAPRRGGAMLVGAILCGFLLSSVQLFPSWELKRISQRATVGGTHNPAYGRIPLSYLPQFLAPWLYYGVQLDLNVPDQAPTNTVEAHLYFGLLSIPIIAFGIYGGVLRDRRLLVWSGLAILGVIYSMGWLIPLVGRWPGFSFFTGAARFGIVTTLGVALVAGASYSRLTRNLRGPTLLLCSALLFAFMIGDLLIVSRLVTYCTIVSHPPVDFVAESPLRELLRKSPELVRLFCRGANLPTLLGVASTPAYLGIAPAAYFDPSKTIPEPLPFDVPPTSAQIEWLQRAGVTHVLSFTELDSKAWPVEFLWKGHDRLLNAAWGRREPFFLYKLNGSRGRLSWSKPSPEDVARITEYTGNRVTAGVFSRKGGRLVLTDLDYPGWTVRVDDEPAEPVVVDGMYRGVDVPSGTHSITWTYAPNSFRYGALLTGATLICLAAVAHFRFWRGTLVAQLVRHQPSGNNPSH